MGKGCIWKHAKKKGLGYICPHPQVLWDPHGVALCPLCAVSQDRHCRRNSQVRTTPFTVEKRKCTQGRRPPHRPPQKTCLSLPCLHPGLPGQRHPPHTLRCWGVKETRDLGRPLLPSPSPLVTPVDRRAAGLPPGDLLNSEEEIVSEETKGHRAPGRLELFPCLSSVLFSGWRQPPAS